MGQAHVAGHWKARAAVVVAAALLLLPWVLGPALRPVPRAGRARAEATARLGSTSAAQPKRFEAIEAELSDHLRFRPWARGLVATVSYSALGRSASSQVIAGRGGWLFLDRDLTTCNISPAAFEANLRALLDRLDEGARKGGRGVVLVVVPDKAVAEPERLGSWGRDALAQCSDPLRAIIERVSAERPRLAFIAPDAIARWGGEPAWTPGESHWTPLASRALVDIVLQRRGVPGDEARRIVESAARPVGRRVAGDLHMLMGLPQSSSRETVAEIVGTSETMIENLSLSPSLRPTRRWVTRNPLRAAEREVAVVGDSFTEHPFPAIAATWGCGTSVTWEPATWQALPATVDFVVLESIQRALVRRLWQLSADSSPFWRWLSTPAPSLPSRTCPSPGR